MATPSPIIHSGTPRATDTLIVAHAIDFKTSKSGYLPRQVKPSLDDVTKKYKELQLVNDVKDASRNFIASHLGESGSQVGPKESVLLFSDNGGLVKGELPKDPGRYTAIVPACVDRVDPLIGTSLPANVAAFQPENLATIFSSASTLQAQMEMFKKELNDQKKSSDQDKEWLRKQQEQLDKRQESLDKKLDKQKELFDQQLSKFDEQLNKQKEENAELKGEIVKLKGEIVKLKGTIQILEKEKEGFHAISKTALEWTTLRDTLDADRIRIRALFVHAQARLACLAQLPDHEAATTTQRAKLWRNLLFSLPETERIQRTRTVIGPDSPESVVAELANPSSILCDQGDQAAHPHIDLAHYRTILRIDRASKEPQPLLNGLVEFLVKK